VVCVAGEQPGRRSLSRPIAALLPALWLAPLAAQAATSLTAVETPVPLASAGEVGLQQISRGGQTVQLQVAPLAPLDSQPIEVPVVEHRADWRFGVSADRRFVVGLAGGIRDDLDLYVVDRRRGRWLRYPTAGGRLLPDRFAGGNGTWPQLQHEHLILFAYARHGRVELRVLDFEARVLASESAPEGVTGVDYRFDESCGEIEVALAGGGPKVRVPHPLAPWLEIVEPSVEFGAAAPGTEVRRELTLRNRGRTLLRVHWAAPNAPFRAGVAPPLEIVPGGTKELTLWFAPAEPGPAQELLRCTTNGPLRRTSVVLRGAGIAPPPPPPAEAPPAEAPARVEQLPQEPAPPPRPAAPPLHIEQDQLVIRCGPARDFLLLAVATPGNRILRSWRGRTDAAGIRRLALDAIGAVGSGFDLVLLWEEGGALRESPRLSVGAR
jgi:hypothetical protein